MFLDHSILRSLEYTMNAHNIDYCILRFFVLWIIDVQVADHCILHLVLGKL